MSERTTPRQETRQQEEEQGTALTTPRDQMIEDRRQPPPIGGGNNTTGSTSSTRRQLQFRDPEAGREAQRRYTQGIDKEARDEERRKGGKKDPTVEPLMNVPELKL